MVVTLRRDGSATLKVWARRTLLVALVAAFACSVLQGAQAAIADPASAIAGDEFDDTQIDPAKWGTTSLRWCDQTAGGATNGTWFDPATVACKGLRQNPPYGQLTESGGTANFSTPTSTRAFPYIWSTDGLLPAAGDFAIDFRMRYSAVAANGDGLRFRPWPDATPSGMNAPANPSVTCATSGVWGDSAGLTVNLAGKRVTLAGATAFQLYRLQYTGGKYLLFRFDAPTSAWRLLIGPVETTLRIDRLWVGNPVFTWWTLAGWSGLQLDYVRVTQPTAIDTDANGVPDAVQIWPPTGGVPASPQPDADADGEPDFCDQQTSVVDMSITKTDSVDPVPADGELTYTVRVDNIGSAAAQNVLVRDVLPEGTTFVSASDGGTYDAATRTVRWSLGTFGAGQAVKALTLRVHVDESRTADLVNTASVETTSSDADGGNDTFTETTAVTPSLPCNALSATDAVEEAFPPADLRLGRYESNRCIYVFAEQQDVRLSRDINPKAPSTTSVLASSNPTRRIPAGTEVDSHLLHFDPVQGPPSLIGLSGHWTFEEPILGISVVRDGLVVGDGLTGLSTLEYEQTSPDRGVEASSTSGDFIRVDPANPNRIELQFRVLGAMDEIRVFTGALDTIPDPCTKTDPADAIEPAPTPDDVRLNQRESAHCLYLYEERQDVTLASNITIKKPLATNMLSGPNVTIPAGSVVDGFLLHGDSPGAPGATTVRLAGTWKFAEPILGVSVTSGGLVNGDTIVGLPDPTVLRYEKTSSARGLEGPGIDSDLVTVDANDPHLLHVDLSYNVMDEIRVFTGVVDPPPDCIPPPDSAVVEEQPDPPPADLRLDHYESNKCIRLFAEEQNVELPVDINVKRPASTNMVGGRNRRIPARQVVSSFLLHGDSLGASGLQSVSLSGHWRFGDPIVGVSVTTDGLVFGDGVTGLADPDVIRYEKASSARGLEDPGVDADAVTVDPNDPHVLHVTFAFNAMDEIRVYTGNLTTGTVVVRKDAVPDSSLDFAFTADGGIEPDNFSLDDDGDETNGLPSSRSFEVLAGAGYSVKETVPAGWDQTGATCADGSPMSNIDVGTGETVTCTFANTRHARIVVVKQTVPDGDPSRFSFSADYRPSGFTLADDESHDSGRLTPGTYSVAETVPTGWQQPRVNCSDGSDPAAIDLGVGEIVTCTFTNERIPPAFVSGTKFLDEDGDGVRSSESGLADWTIRAYRDADGDGVLGSGETTVAAQTSTGLDGAYRLTLLPGSYVVCEVAEATWEQTVPSGDRCAAVTGLAAGGHAVTLAARDEVGGRDFGNRLRRAHITGVKFRDEGADGSSVGDDRVSGWAIRAYRDANGDGLASPGETSVATLTGPDGGYRLTVAPGKYVVCEEVRAGWEQTAPPPEPAQCAAFVGLEAAGYAVSLAPGETAPDRDFGNRVRRVVISGVKFLDENGDGVQSGEGGLRDWTIRVYRDDNHDGALGDGETAVVAETSTALDGGYSFTLAPGSYVVCEVAVAEWEQATPSGNACGDGIAGLADGGYGLTLGPGERATDGNFGNRLRRGSIVITKTTVGGDGSFRFDGPAGLPAPADENGDFTVETSAGSGSASLNGLAPRRYVISELVPAGWDLTRLDCDDDASRTPSAVAAPTASVEVDPGETVTCTFSNRKRASIAIVKDSVPDHPQDVDFSTTGADLSAFTLDDDGDATNELSNARTISDLTSFETKTVTESIPAHWRLTGISCTGDADLLIGGDADFDAGDAAVTIDLDPGEDVRCTFTNQPIADIELTKTDRVDPVEVGKLFDYLLTVTNRGPGPATGVTINDTLPAGTRFDSASDGGLYNPFTGVVTWHLGSLAASASRQVTLTVYVNRECRTALSNTASVTAATPDDVPGNNAWTEPTSIDSVVGSPGTTAELLVGSSRNNVIISDEGADTLKGGNGEDVLCGFGGNDVLVGGDENDLLIGGNGDATHDDGLDGIDTVAYSDYRNPAANPAWAGAATGWRINLTTGVAAEVDNGTETDSLHELDNVIGSGFNDSITGDIGTNGLYGRAGHDGVVGGGSADTIHGDEGNDDLRGDAGNDSVSGGAGSDTLNGNDGVDTMAGNEGNDEIHGDAGDDRIGGDAGSDTIFGEADDDALNGEAGDDTLAGGGGNDDMFGGPDNDTMTGGDGIDRMAGDSGMRYDASSGASDVLSGGDGNDLLLGQGGDDRELFGANGVDRIHGGVGADRLDGGGPAVDGLGTPSPNVVNNVLYGAGGTDICSNGPLTASRYAGTDRGDIRHGTCEQVAAGATQKGQSEKAIWAGSFYTFSRISINEGTVFAWDSFRGQTL
jgi:uncharacterized repeat protein (TIGR01451 family)